MALPSPVAATAGDEGNTARPRYEVADVVRRYGDEYVRTHLTTGAQRRVLRAIAHCRTAVLGGHREQCESCGQQRLAYNSCRNRHCPKCQGKERARWLAAEQALLLPVPYFHLVFTLPHRLNALVPANRRGLYTLLFRVAAATLRTFAHDPRYLGAEPAITMVLHTWGQTLIEHFHVHCVVSGGGLSRDGCTWVRLPKHRPKKPRRRRPFLFPVEALSVVFRGKYIAALKRARRNSELRFAGHSAGLADPLRWQELLDALAQTDWVVYCKPPFGGPAQVLKYLSRYTHRVAISNRRLRFVGAGTVRFTYRDYADHAQDKELVLSAPEFLRRFLLHVVPCGFMRIRHYGLTANCQRAPRLQRCRELLGLGQAAHTPTDPATSTAESAPKLCPHCGGHLRVVAILPPIRRHALRLAAPYDTS
jgi:hypothetical protein